MREEPALLFRRSLASKYELRHAEKYFRIEESRVRCHNCLVVGRYAIEPFYDELDSDLHLLGSRLINTPEEHRWITSFDYYQQLQGFTPETWDEENFYMCQYPGPFVVKGKLNSKKHNWDTHMFAASKQAALEVAERLKVDADLRQQGVVFRKYVPLLTYEVGLHGLRYTNEWRLFFFGETLLSAGYYWSLADCLDRVELKPPGMQLARDVARIAGKFTKFYTLDVAETEEGDWILIEINDGQTAVPGENDLDELYCNLREAIT